MKLTPLLFSGALALGSLAQAGDTSSQPFVRIAVAVNVKAGEAVGSAVKANLIRELNGLNDVIITDTSPLYRVECLVRKTSERRGAASAYALSFIVTSTMPATLTMILVGDQLPENQGQALRELHAHRGVVVDHQMDICSSDSISNACANFVGGFNRTLIDSARQFGERYFAAAMAGAADRTSLKTPQLTGFTLGQVDKNSGFEDLEGNSLPPLAEFRPHLVVQGVQLGERLAVRSGPGLNFPTVVSLPNGSSGVRLIRGTLTDDKSEWVQIEIGSQEGWVRKKYLKPE